MNKVQGDNRLLVKILLILAILAVGSYVISISWQVISFFFGLAGLLFVTWLVSVILEPLVNWITKALKVSVMGATAVTYFVVFILLVIIAVVYFPLLTSQVVTLANMLPGIANTLPSWMTKWSQSLTTVLDNSISLIPSVFQFLLSTTMVLILSFYMIVDREKIRKEIGEIFPKSWHKNMLFVEKVVNEVFVSFLKVQLFYGLAAAVLTWLILRVFNIELALSVAFLAGILTMIPLVGGVLAVVLPAMVTLLVSPSTALVVAILLLVEQLVVFNIVGPKLLGKAFRIHPAIILFSFLVGLRLAGGIGALLAIPVLGVGTIVVKRFGHHLREIRQEAMKNFRTKN